MKNLYKLSIVDYYVVAESGEKARQQMINMVGDINIESISNIQFLDDEKSPHSRIVNDFRTIGEFISDKDQKIENCMLDLLEQQEMSYNDFNNHFYNDVCGAKVFSILQGLVDSGKVILTGNYYHLPHLSDEQLCDKIINVLTDSPSTYLPDELLAYETRIDYNKCMKLLDILISEKKVCWIFDKGEQLYCLAKQETTEEEFIGAYI